MRETKAKGVALGTGALILGAVVLFAFLQQVDSAVATNGVETDRSAASDVAPIDPGDAPPARTGEDRPGAQRGEDRSGARPVALQVPDSILDAGRAVYEEQDCSVCHSIAGEGNPRYPLDGVGARLEEREIRLWIVDPQEVRPDVRKPAFDDLPEDEVDALVAYLLSLTES